MKEIIQSASFSVLKQSVTIALDRSNITCRRPEQNCGKEFDRSLFRWIRPYAEIRDCRRQVILSHYPVFCYKGQYRMTPEGTPLTYMLYGHVHNTHDERLVNEFIRITRSTMVKSARQTEEHPIPCNMINASACFRIIFR